MFLNEYGIGLIRKLCYMTTITRCKRKGIMFDKRLMQVVYEKARGLINLG